MEHRPWWVKGGWVQEAADKASPHWSKFFFPRYRLREPSKPEDIMPRVVDRSSQVRLAQHDGCNCGRGRWRGCFLLVPVQRGGCPDDANGCTTMFSAAHGRIRMRALKEASATHSQIVAPDTRRTAFVVGDRMEFRGLGHVGGNPQSRCCRSHVSLGLHERAGGIGPQEIGRRAREAPYCSKTANSARLLAACFRDKMALFPAINAARP